MIEFSFWASLLLVVYGYIGYPIVLQIVAFFYDSNNQKSNKERQVSITVAHIIAAYNEEDCIVEKIENSLSLSYDSSLLKTIVVTDGSTDKTPIIASSFSQVAHYHKDDRGGKIAAIKRILPLLDCDILLFSDANTMLNLDAVHEMVSAFGDPRVGAVAGEKVVASDDRDDASGAGESIYWRYEAWIKRNESIISSTVGAAGELYAVRRELFEFPEEDIYVEDLYTSLSVVKHGYRVGYCHDARATEGPSSGIREEMKRKVRIAARGISTIPMLIPFLNPFRFFWTSLFLFSHKIFRWILSPILLIWIFISNVCLLGNGKTYTYLLAVQVLFYLEAILGFLLAERRIRFKLFFIPFYFVFAQYCVLLSYFQYFSNRTQVAWERSERRVVG